MKGPPTGQLGLDLAPPRQRLGEGEAWARRRGLRSIVGVDEVGRGPLAGPVVAAAVVLTRELEDALVEAGLDDSKRLGERARAELARRIREEAVVGIGEVGPRRIDQINILQATFEAMRVAVRKVSQALGEGHADCLLVDGNRAIDPSPLPQAVQHTLVKGDQRAVCIAAASVVAKVHRDALMVDYDRAYPGYDFASNKGYPSAAHREGLRELGPTPIHRRSFRGVLPEPEARG